MDQKLAICSPGPFQTRNKVLNVVKQKNAFTNKYSLLASLAHRVTKSYFNVDPPIPKYANTWKVGVLLD